MTRNQNTGHRSRPRIRPSRKNRARKSVRIHSFMRIIPAVLKCQRFIHLFWNECVFFFFCTEYNVIKQSACVVCVAFRGVGCILYELATGRPMFPGSTVKEELHLVFRLMGTFSFWQLQHSAKKKKKSKLFSKHLRHVICLTYKKLQSPEEHHPSSLIRPYLFCNHCSNLAFWSLFKAEFIPLLYHLKNKNFFF